MFDFKYYALSALAVLISLTVHEFSHAFVADKLGDHTARNLGRLSLNPIKHLDIIGALCMLVFKFGWVPYKSIQSVPEVPEGVVNIRSRVFLHIGNICIAVAEIHKLAD